MALDVKKDVSFIANPEREILKIYIKEKLHLMIGIPTGIQSWMDEDKYTPYKIELYFENKNNIRLEYTNRDLWEAILDILDENLN